MNRQLRHPFAGEILPVTRLELLAGLRCRIRDPRGDGVHPVAARVGVRPGQARGESFASTVHFPLTAWIGDLFQGLSTTTLEDAILGVAALKVLVSFTWMIIISVQPTMGVAWHRFLAFFNIWFKRHADGHLAGRPATDPGGRTADRFRERRRPGRRHLVGRRRSGGLLLEGLVGLPDLHRMRPLPSPGARHGSTEKPLSPKLLVLNLRDHANAKAPWLQATEEARAAEGGVLTSAVAASERPLVGPGTPDPSRPIEGGVIDPGRAVVLHHLWGVRGAVSGGHRTRRPHCRYAAASGTDGIGVPQGTRRPVQEPGEERQPWGLAPRLRMDWAKDLDFEVKQVGADVEDLTEVEYLYWVGCAGAFEDRGKKTAAAIATLLHEAGVDFAVLGDGEACTGDPARRAGWQMLFQIVGDAERRGVERGEGDQDRRHLRALLQHHRERVPATWREV